LQPDCIDADREAVVHCPRGGLCQLDPGVFNAGPLARSVYLPEDFLPVSGRVSSAVQTLGRCQEQQGFASPPTVRPFLEAAIFSGTHPGGGDSRRLTRNTREPPDRRSAGTDRRGSAHLKSNELHRNG
jgi:hypothetical protein